MRTTRSRLCSVIVEDNVSIVALAFMFSLEWLCFYLFFLFYVNILTTTKLYPYNEGIVKEACLQFSSSVVCRMYVYVERMVIYLCIKIC